MKIYGFEHTTDLAHDDVSPYVRALKGHLMAQANKNLIREMLVQKNKINAVYSAADIIDEYHSLPSKCSGSEPRGPLVH